MNKTRGVHGAAGDERNKCFPPTENLLDTVHPQCKTCFAELLSPVSKTVLRVVIGGPRHRSRCKRTRSNTVLRVVLACEMPDPHNHKAEQHGEPRAAISIHPGPCLRYSSGLNRKAQGRKPAGKGPPPDHLELAA